jgi:carbon-monoxide dehydrogenase large subunit
MTVLGRAEPRIEDRQLLTGEAAYATDLSPPGSALVVFARSQVAHALISVDVGAARKRPGVIAAYTAKTSTSPSGRRLPCRGTPSPWRA